jgi:hypothetical protein
LAVTPAALRKPLRRRPELLQRLDCRSCLLDAAGFLDEFPDVCSICSALSRPTSWCSARAAGLRLMIVRVLRHGAPPCKSWETWNEHRPKPLQFFGPPSSAGKRLGKLYGLSFSAAGELKTVSRTGR